MTKREMEKRLAEYLDERWMVIRVLGTLECSVNARLFYDSVCATIAQIGSWERREDGKHFVNLNL